MLSSHLKYLKSDDNKLQIDDKFTVGKYLNNNIRLYVFEQFQLSKLFRYNTIHLDNLTTLKIDLTMEQKRQNQKQNTHMHREREREGERERERERETITESKQNILNL